MPTDTNIGFRFVFSYEAGLAALKRRIAEQMKNAGVDKEKIHSCLFDRDSPMLAILDV